MPSTVWSPCRVELLAASECNLYTGNLYRVPAQCAGMHLASESRLCDLNRSSEPRRRQRNHAGTSLPPGPTAQATTPIASGCTKQSLCAGCLRKLYPTPGNIFDGLERDGVPIHDNT